MPPNKQNRNWALEQQLMPKFQSRLEAQFAWKSAVSALLGLPVLRAAWPMSSVGYQAADRARDVSAQGNHLTANSDTFLHFRYDVLIPYARIASANNDWLSRADGGVNNWADITGTEGYILAAQLGLTLGGWFYLDDAAGSNEALMAKWDSAANERSYLLRRDIAGVLSFYVSDNGINAPGVSSTSSPSVAGWFFVAGRYMPDPGGGNGEIKVWHNTAAVTAASTYASLHNGAANFTIGRYSNALYYLNGRASLCFLCAAALPDVIISQFYHQTRVMFGHV